MKKLLFLLFAFNLSTNLWSQTTNSPEMPAPDIPQPSEPTPDGLSTNASSSWPPNLDEFMVETASPENKVIPFYVRIPMGFDPQQPGPYRILFICPYLNHDGFLTITGLESNQELLDVADQRKWFIVTPTFQQKEEEGHDKNLSYYYPEKFSGKAVLDALDLIARKYPVDTNHLLIQGLSGGAQFTHRFALWAPDHVVAAAINSSSWFDNPATTCNQVAWLITIGDSDPSFENTLNFIEKLEDAGAAPLFRSYIGMTHEGDGRVTHLDAEFLKFYDDQTHGQLGKPKDTFQNSVSLPMQAKDMPFVGDNQSWKYVPNSDANRAMIGEDSRVFLPSKEIADIWGLPKK